MQITSDGTLDTIIVVAIVVLSASFHEAAHALAALWRGDSTARDEGRLTLNPLVHIDPFQTILIPLMFYVASSGRFVLGGARPVPVRLDRLRGEMDWLLVAIAGPISNILLSLVFVSACLPIASHVEPGSVGYALLMTIIVVNLIMAVFNMIPIPPLDGSRVIRYFLPGEGKHFMDRLEHSGAGFLVLLLFLFLGGSAYVGTVVGWLAGLVHEIFSRANHGGIF